MSCLPSVNTSSNLSGKPALLAHHQAVGGRSAEGTAKVEGEQPGRRGHRGDASGRAGPTSRGLDQHDGVDLFADSEGALDHRRCHAALAAAVGHQCGKYRPTDEQIVRIKTDNLFQVFYYSTSLFVSSGLSEEHAKFATMGIGAIMVVMTVVSIPLMDRTGRRTLHLYGLGGMFIFSIFITISFLIKVGSLALLHLSSVLAIER
jgi:hypothetical protein